MTAELAVSVERRGSNWSDAFGYLRDQAEDSGVLGLKKLATFSGMGERLGVL